jgi:hypothetical protein
MAESIEEEKTVKGYVTFDQDTLRRIHLMQSNRGNFCVRVYILDRDSVQMTRTNSYYLPSTLRDVVGMYIGNFLDIDNMEFNDPMTAKE